MSDISQTTKEEKIYNLVVELEEAKRDKKDIVKAHNENIKRIQVDSWSKDGTKIFSYQLDVEPGQIFEVTAK